MLKKLVKLILISLIVIPLLAQNRASAQTTVSECQITTEPAVLTPDDKVFKVFITPSRPDMFEFNQDYFLEIKDEGGFLLGALEQKIIPFKGNGINRIGPISAITPHGSPQGRVNLTVLGKPCFGTTTVGISPKNCKIVPILKDGKDPIPGVAFKVIGLAGGDAIRRGFEIGDRDDAFGTHIKTCATDKELGQAIYSGKLREGVYRISLTQSCSLLNMPDGPSICRTSDGKSYIEYGVSANGNFALGAECDPSPEKTDEKTGKNSDCNVNSPAPYCVTSDDGESGACSNIRGVVERCKTVSGKTTCKTAIGPISTDPKEFIAKLMQILLGLSGGILLLFLVINGYKLMASQGDPEKVKEARESIGSAIVGLLFIIFSIFILSLITVDILKIPGFQ